MTVLRKIAPILIAVGVVAVGLPLADVLIPEPTPHERMAEVIGEECGLDIDADTANTTDLAPVRQSERWTWNGVRFRAESGEYVAIYVLQNDDGVTQGEPDIYCPDQTAGWSKRG